MSKNLIARIAVAVVAIPAILWVCYQGGYWLAGMVSFFAMIALYEFLYNESIKPDKLIFWIAYLTVILMLLEQVINASPYNYTVLNNFDTGFGVMFLLVTGMIFSVGKGNPSELFSKYTRLFWGIIYIACLYPFVYILGFYQLDTISGGDILLFLFGVLWLGDTAAMFGGKAFGKHKLAPAVSPNKTVEGFISGILGALIIGIIMFFWKLEPLGLLHVLLMALGCSVFGQLGDLVESMWKRSLNIKDSSAIIPGHGGILDRFDSLLFAAPFLFFYLKYIV